MGKIMLDTSFPNNPAWIREGGAYAQALHLGALAYSDAQGLDGVIPADLIPRLAFACPPELAGQSAKMLVEFGFWSENVPGHYVINNYERTNFTKAQADAFRDREAAKKRRQRLHSAGDHSLCTNPKWCPSLKDTRGESPKVSRGDKRGTGPGDTRGSIPLHSKRPQGSARVDGNGGGPNGPAQASAGAPATASPGPQKTGEAQEWPFGYMSGPDILANTMRGLLADHRDSADD